MTSNGTFSDRFALPVPGDGQDEPADDQTQARNISDADTENWGDIIQTLLLDDKFLDGKLVDSGTLASRGTAGTGEPKLYVVTDGGDSNDQAYLSYNDDSNWHLVGEVMQRKAITDGDSPYAASDGESIWVDASSAAVTVNLPAPSDGLSLRVVVTDATNDVTVSRNASENINGSASDLTISSERGVQLESDGTNWRTTEDTAGSASSLAGSGLEERSGKLQVKTVVSNNVVTLSSGSAVVSTGVTSTPAYFDVYLDPAGNGNNTSDVKAAARAFWDNSAGEYKVEILEDGTSVGNPDIGVRVVQY